MNDRAYKNQKRDRRKIRLHHCGGGKCWFSPRMEMATGTEYVSG